MMKFDLHVHTTLSSCSQLQLTDILREARGKGLDGVCITDHQTMDILRDVTEGIQDDGLCLIAGMEYATPDGDFLVFGSFDALPDGLTARELLHLVDIAGGVAVAAHPFREGRRTNKEIVAGRHCRIMEGRNGRGNGDDGYARALEWQERYDIHLAGGSDAHTLEELGRTVTVFEQAVRSKEEFIRALKSGRYRPESNPS